MHKATKLLRALVGAAVESQVEVTAKLRVVVGAAGRVSRGREAPGVPRALLEAATESQGVEGAVGAQGGAEGCAYYEEY